ncbi:biotin synthase BioB [bacterium]|nr:MAG: biotin synthase BioB [bacterium]
MNFSDLASKALRDEALSRDEAYAVLCASSNDFEAVMDAALTVREAHFGRRVKLCMLLNAQSGICPEDCSYCSQSKISTAPVEKYRLLAPEKIVERAQEAVEAGATRFCMAIAARGATERDIQHIGQAVGQIKSDPKTAHLEICTSLGLLNEQKCQQLKDVGVDYVNHNLNTGPKFYPKICSTHTFEDRLDTLRNVQTAGLSTCAGGIVGLGESVDDLLDMAFALRELGVTSIPINVLLRIKGVSLVNNAPVPGLHALQAMCLMRLTNPRAEVRAAAGREKLGDLQPRVLWPANSLFVDGYLTTPGESAAIVKGWVEAAGFEIETPVAV